MVKAGDEISTDPQIEACLEIGVGADVLDRLLELTVDVVGLNGGAQPVDKERFTVTSVLPRKHGTSSHVSTFKRRPRSLATPPATTLCRPHTIDLPRAVADKHHAHVSRQLERDCIAFQCRAAPPVVAGRFAW
jgi:hypothetical protein